MTFNKISFPDEYKRMFTLSDLESCKKLKESIKNDDGKIDLSWEAAMAASIGSDGHVGDGQILAARAEFAKNQRVWQYYCDDSKQMDIWIEVKAFDPCYGFYDIGIYLSDIWQYFSEVKYETMKQMFIKHYVLEK